MHAIGVDIGGTKIAAGVVDEDGSILAQTRRDTSPDDAAGIDRAIADVYAELSESYEVSAMGLAAAGFVSADRSSVLFAPNIAWRDYPLRDRVAALVQDDVTIVVENDANAAGWAEFRFGAGRDVDDMLMLTVGTGLGGAIVTDGKLAWDTRLTELYRTETDAIRLIKHKEFLVGLEDTLDVCNDVGRALETIVIKNA